MVETNRSLVAGWDTENARPKGVASARDVRASLSMIADRPGIAWGERAAEVSLSSSAMALSWTGFNAVIPSPGGGWYTPRVQAGSVGLQVGDGTYPRLDIIYVRQWDYEVAADHPDSEVEVGVVTGTPSATPQLPAVPDGALVVFTVTVPRGATRGVDIGASGVVRAPWSYPAAPPYPAPALPLPNRDITGLFRLVDTGGWIKAGDWYARQVGNLVILQVVLRGPWKETSSWQEKPLLSIDASVKPYHPGRNASIMAPVATSAGGAGAYLIAYPDTVKLGIKGSTSWTAHPQSLTWAIK